MFKSKKMNALIILILLGIIVTFAFVYNGSVRETVFGLAINDKELLYSYNNEIISKLVEQDSTDDWSRIVEEYDDVVIVIEDSENSVVTKSSGRTGSAIDVNVQTPFEYKDKAYLIKSSVYLLREYVAERKVIFKFILVETLIVLSAFALLVLTVYTIMLRPFIKLYESIEEYDRTGRLKKTNIVGYAGQVYERFVSLTKNLETNQNNQRRIIASISHDIKTPLTSIMGYAEQLQKDSVTEERKKRYLNTVYDKSIEIKELVNEFDEYLSFNQSQPLSLHLCSTETITQKLKEEYAVELEEIGVDFEVKNYAGDTPICVDRQKIKRVFGNILSNSIKHFRTDKKLISISINADKKTVYIDVDDNGEGVEKEKLDIIFEPLYTSDEGRKVAGLGLAICHEIIDGHRGKIYAEESELGGLKVRIELPVAVTDKNVTVKNKKRRGAQ